MPGLKQLKKFTSDIQNIGDEVKIRSKRGEKVAKIPLPEGISEEDDSKDFILGLPEEEIAEQEELSDENQESPFDPLDFDSLDSPDSLDANVNFDSLLNNNSSANQSDLDLSDFLDEDEQAKTPQAEEIAPEIHEEKPLEDLDLDSLLNFSNDENNDENSNDDLNDDLNIEELNPADENSVVPDIDDFLSENEIKTDNSNKNDSDDFDEFSFDGNELNLNEDIPEEISSIDGTPLTVPPENENPFESQNDSANVSANDSAFDEIGEIGEIENSTEKEDSLAEENEIPFESDNLNESETEKDENENPLSEENEILPEDFSTDFLDKIDFPSSDEFDSPENDLSENENPLPNEDFSDVKKDFVDATVDVNPEEFAFDPASAVEEIHNVDDINFGETPKNNDEFPVTDLSPTDDFIFDENDFAIPGFSDTQTADFGKAKRRVDTADFSKAKQGKPKNSLTDEEYDEFKKNLMNYPLNLRLAIEDLIVKDEFTDDAVFEVVEKIVKKTPARQLATHLEKMLGISIDVPRDYERRSFSEYEAYKQSFQYQLKNRIIPGGILAGVLAFVCYLLFQAGVLFIYKPSMASSLYKQGYALLQENAYPQSEVKFNEAVKFKPVKKWFFKYAEGYTEHKQFERASQMYKNILGVFKHDKKAGLDYAKMELYERGNFSRAEEIIRRDVLDYHINDKDALLLLGDVFLEWAEVDNQKYEDAREAYSNLMQIYGQNDLYLSRMMRYFIRTDKLKNTLELKNYFYPREKSLCSDDWVELSGYLLDKLYGKLNRQEEYLRSQIEDVYSMLEISVRLAFENPVSHYNMGRYHIENNNFANAKIELNKSLEQFENLTKRTKKNTYRQINAYRLSGELYTDTREYLKAQELYTKGIELFQTENEKTAFEGDENTGKLYADMGDIEYFISGDENAALENYILSTKNKNDTASVNYRIGVINYHKDDYENAMNHFIKAFETEESDENLLLALGNTLSLRGNNFGAAGYYSQLLDILNNEKSRNLMLFPQTKSEDNFLVEQFLKVNNNLGVSLYRIAKQTGDSSIFGKAMVRISDSIRAWDALTRNPESMERLGGSNLALQNSKYMTASVIDFEPAIYTDISKTLTDEKILQ